MGIPLLVMNVDYDDNDDAHDRVTGARRPAEMLEAAGCRDVETHDKDWAPGLDIHEMAARAWGKDPRASCPQSMEPGARLQERLRH